MKTSTKVIIFLALNAFYILLIDLTGAKFRFFSGRYSGIGMDGYLLADYLACFCSGPFVGPMDPYPYRSTCVFLGGLMMMVELFWKFLVLR